MTRQKELYREKDMSVENKLRKVKINCYKRQKE